MELTERTPTSPTAPRQCSHLVHLRTPTVFIPDLLPAELCIQIFTLACVDGGFTGRSLSLVSRHVMTLSKSANALTTQAQIEKLHILPRNDPLHSSDIYHLFIMSPPLYHDLEVMDLRRGFGEEVFKGEANFRGKIREIVTPLHALLTLALHLELHFSSNLTDLLPAMPTLLRFSVVCEKMELSYPDPSAVWFPSLRRFRVGGESSLDGSGAWFSDTTLAFVKISMPSLTHPESRTLRSYAAQNW